MVQSINGHLLESHCESELGTVHMLATRVLCALVFDAIIGAVLDINESIRKRPRH